MSWLSEMKDKWGKKKTRMYKAEALPDGESRNVMVAKADEPVNEMGTTASELIDHYRSYGALEKLDAGYTEPSADAAKLCAGCMFFIRNPWGMSDSCQMVNGSIVWYGTCKLRIDANEQAAIVYAEEIGEYAAKEKDAKARALPAAASGAVSEDKWDGSGTIADMDIATLKKSTLAFIGGDTEKKGNYKLPYRDAGGKINAAAVRAIKAVLGGARGGVDLPEDIRAAVEKNAGKLMDYVEAKLKKSADGDVLVTREIAIVKSEDEQRLVFGVVYEPDVVDTHGDTMSAAEIEKACNLYGASMQVVNKQHGEDVAVDVVQNYIAPADFIADNGVTVKKGTWLQVMKVHDDSLWAKIKSGEMTGYSFEGYAVRTPVAE